MDKYNTYDLELKLICFIDKIFQNDIRINKDVSMYSIFNQNGSINFEVFDNKYVYYLNFQGKTQVLPFILEFYFDTQLTSLYYCNGIKNTLFSENFSPKTMHYLFSFTKNVTIQIQKALTSWRAFLLFIFLLFFLVRWWVGRWEFSR